MKEILVNKHASALVHLRWDKLSPAERAAQVPRNGGRPRQYPQCPKAKCHRWNRKDGKCRLCGLARPTMTASKAKKAFRSLVAQYGLRWSENAPKSAIELLEQVSQVLGAVLSDEEKQELIRKSANP